MGKMSEVFTAQQRVSELATKVVLSEAEQADYGQSVATLLAYYGPNADASLIDPALADEYAEAFEALKGWRPKEFSYVTAAQFIAAVHNRADGDADPELEEDRFDPDITDWLNVPSDEEADFHARVRDYEDVFGVSAFGDAMRTVH